MLNAKGNAPSYLVIGLSAIFAPFAGGVMVPAPNFILAFQANSQGSLSLVGPWPDGVPPDTDIYFQYWIEDSAGPQGFAASNALRATVP